MTGNRLLRIPELLSLIGQHLDQHDLTLCIRVCCEWFDTFTPFLYHTIAVYDFDLYSHKFEDAATRAQRSAKNAHLASSDDDPGYGGSMVYKYAHLIHSIASPNIHALAYLGDQAVNLTHVSLLPDFPDPVVFRPLNPGLKSVRIDLNHCDSGAERIIHALAKREHLEDVYLESVVEANTLEMMLDHCPHILSLSATFGHRDDYVHGIDHQIFKAESMGCVGTPTNIRHLSIRNTETWISHVLRRCPDLQTLMLPSVDMGVFTILAQEVITLSSSKFFSLHSLELTLRALTAGANNVLTATLLNSCSASLAALTITDISRQDFGRTVIPSIDPLLWSRLEEFRYTGLDVYGLFTPSYSLCNVLALCPNLRVFEVSHTMVTATEFLSTRYVCGQSLVALTLTVCSDHTQIFQAPQPQPGLQTPFSFPLNEVHMAAMAQYALPISIPLQPQAPQWPHQPYVPPYIPPEPPAFQLATMAQFELPTPIHHPEAHLSQQPLASAPLPIFTPPLAPPPPIINNNNNNNNNN
ncbi:hypothetical protein BGZ47_005021 [Haplosporangium gracile]|nr:hypothetical protein BGZ47_005021 [Haplosporangium gracile]